MNQDAEHDNNYNTMDTCCKIQVLRNAVDIHNINIVNKQSVLYSKHTLHTKQHIQTYPGLMLCVFITGYIYIDE